MIHRVASIIEDFDIIIALLSSKSFHGQSDDRDLWIGDLKYEKLGLQFGQDEQDDTEDSK